MLLTFIVTACSFCFKSFILVSFRSQPRRCCEAARSPAVLLGFGLCQEVGCLRCSPACPRRHLQTRAWATWTRFPAPLSSSPAPRQLHLDLWAWTHLWRTACDCGCIFKHVIVNRFYILQACLLLGWTRMKDFTITAQVNTGWALTWKPNSLCCQSKSLKCLWHFCSSFVPTFIRNVKCKRSWKYIEAIVICHLNTVAAYSLLNAVCKM